MNLTEFLLARIAEDEAAAKAARGWQTGSRHEGQPLDWSIHMDRWSPDRVLAEVEAKRQMVEWYQAVAASSYKTSMGFLTRLALPYADHPDYQQEWRP